MISRTRMNMALLDGAIRRGVMPTVAVSGEGAKARVALGIGDNLMFAYSPEGAREVAKVWRANMAASPAAGVAELLEIAADVCQAQREQGR